MRILFGEVSVELQEHVRGRDIFVLQSTSAPCNDNLMELLVVVDSLKRASAGRITAAIPYFGYARQDRRSRSSRVPIAAKLVANMLVASGVDRVLTMDLHAEQIQGFFDIPVDNIYALPILLDDIKKQLDASPGLDLQSLDPTKQIKSAIQEGMAEGEKAMAEAKAAIDNPLAEPESAPQVAVDPPAPITSAALPEPAPEPAPAAAPATAAAEDKPKAVAAG